MRAIEAALLFIPVALAIAWWYGIRGLSLRGVVAAVLLLAGFEAALFWAGSDRAVRGHYVPAHVEDGRVVPGHGR